MGASLAAYSQFRASPAAVIAAVGLIVYANSFTVPFVFDDYLLLPDPVVTDPLSSIAKVAERNRPLGFLTFALNHAMGGETVWGYHAVNLAIHVAAALALMGIVRRTLESDRLRDKFGESARGLSLAAALVWLAHPLQTESVTYIMQRFECLAGLFYLLTLYCFIRGADDRQRAVRWYGLSLVCFGLGLLTKEIVATAPLVLVWYDRVFLARSWRDAVARRWKFYLGLAAVWGLLMAPLALDVFQKLRPQILPETASQQDLIDLSQAKAARPSAVVVEGISPLDYARTQCGVVLWYLRLAIWPDPLCFDYAWPVARSTADAMPQILAIGILLVLVAWCAVKRPVWGFLGGCFFLILLPTSSFVPIQDIAAEHRMYLPLAPLVVMGVMAGFKVVESLRPARSRKGNQSLALHGSVAAGVVVLLSIPTIFRNHDYRDGVALWSDVVAKAPHNVRGHFNLACMLEEQGRISGAIAGYRKAIDLDPRYAEAHSKLGAALLARGEVDAAEQAMRAAIAINPDLFWPRCNLGIILAEQGELQEAIEHLRIAVGWRQDSPEVRFDLANVLLANNDVAVAMDQYREALRLRPEFHAAADRLAWILATHASPKIRDPARAIELARRACDLTGGTDPAYLDTLAAAYGAAGRYDQAIETAERGRQMALAQNQPDVAEAIRSRMLFYAAGRPFRQPTEEPARPLGKSATRPAAENRQRSCGPVKRRDSELTKTFTVSGKTRQSLSAG